MRFTPFRIASLRVHMIIDHIAGMTDDYALKTYQVCKGITINTL